MYICNIISECLNQAIPCNTSASSLSATTLDREISCSISGSIFIRCNCCHKIYYLRLNSAMNISGNNSWSDESLYIIYKPWEITLCAFILTFGLVANVMLLIAQRRDPLRCFGTISTCFIQHIAIIDCLGLLVSCSVLVIAVRTNRPFYVGSNHV